MPLVKWLRKNNRKVMAIVVIVIMIGFIGGSYLQQLGRRRTGMHRTVAYFAENEKITNYDLAVARQELEILRMLQADDLLKSITVVLLRTPDLHSVLLGELLFSERSIAPTLIRNIKQTVNANEYRISEKQINDIYRRPAGYEMEWLYWLLLKKEVERAGVRISNEDAGKELARAIPQLIVGATYSQVVGSIVRRQGIPEEKILQTFGSLMSVLKYARMVCSGTDLTDSQVLHNAVWVQESFDVELVKFDSAVFADDRPEPDKQQILEHFEKYKNFFPGDANDQNPYGFGYKLADRVQVEYIALKLDDVSGIVEAPTQQQAEEYYQNHRDEFTETVPSDPNDPNSPQIEKTRSYAQVAGIISSQLLRSKINAKAELILREAASLTDVRLQEPDVDVASLSSEQLRNMAGDYGDAVEQLKDKHKINIYTGRTGLLSAADMVTDEQLAMMYVQGYGYNNPVELTRVVFAVDPLKSSDLGQFEAPKPGMYENIGPVKDMLGRTMAIMRVVAAEKASQPAAVSQILNKQGLKFEPEPSLRADDTYSIQEKVSEDLKKLAAMDIAGRMVEEFLGVVDKDGWDAALERFNKLYGSNTPKVSTGNDAPLPFELQKLTDVRRIPTVAMLGLVVRSEGNPSAKLSVNEVRKESQLREKLYCLVPADANSPEKLPVVVEFKPEMSYYCVKDISVKRLDRPTYDRVKSVQVYKEEFIQSQSLAPVYFNPENILKRTAFRWAGRELELMDIDEQTEPPGDDF